MIQEQLQKRKEDEIKIFDDEGEDDGIGSILNSELVYITSRQ